MLLEHARQVTVQLVQNGKWKKVKGLYDTGNTLRDATTKKPVSVVPYTVILELFPDEMRTGIAALARHETVPEPEQLLALHAPLHTVSRTGRRGLSAGDPDLGNDSCDRTYSQAHKRTADCAWRRK